jgi:hypothetical protein
MLPIHKGLFRHSLAAAAEHIQSGDGVGAGEAPGRFDTADTMQPRGLHGVRGHIARQRHPHEEKRRRFFVGAFLFQQRIMTVISSGDPVGSGDARELFDTPHVAWLSRQCDPGKGEGDAKEPHAKKEADSATHALPFFR